MSNTLKNSLKDTFKAAAAGSAAISVAASVAIGMGSLGIVAGAVGMAGSAMALGFRKKAGAAAIGALPAEPPAPEEIEISVETGAPVKTMKQIRLRR